MATKTPFWLNENTHSPATMLEAARETSESSPKFWALVTEDVVKKSGAFLAQVNDIPRLYRRTNKEVCFLV